MVENGASLSSWRAWIEIHPFLYEKMSDVCRSPHGERGLKFGGLAFLIGLLGRSPHGERGLKCSCMHRDGCGGVSLSSWRAWIEIDSRSACRARTCRSPHGERGLKSVREIAHGHKILVALLMESVD